MNEKFNENLRKARREKKLTQQQVADLLGVAKSTYCQYETGASEPNILRLKKLAKILGTNIDSLLGIEPPEQLERDFDTLKSKFGEDRLAAYFEALKKVIE
jgi:transcriptional regulator with XRE-family HTH domain